MQENKELYFGYFKHISQNIIFNDYVNLLPLNSYFKSFYLKIVTYFPFSAFLSLRNTSQIYFPGFKFVFISSEIINSNIVYIHTNDKFYILLSCNDNLVRFE